MIYKPFFRDDLGYKPRYTQPLHLEEVVVSPIYSESEDYKTDLNSLGYKPIYSIDPEGVVSDDSKSDSTLSYTFASKEDFKSTMLPIYEKILSEKGINPIFAKSLVAQDGLESAWGSKPSGDNNFGGIKGKGKILKTREVENGKDVYKDQEFRNFASLEDYAKYKVNLLDGKKYKAFDGGLEDFSRRVSAGGYATDPRYKEVLDRVIRNVKKGGILKAFNGVKTEAKWTPSDDYYDWLLNFEDHGTVASKSAEGEGLFVLWGLDGIEDERGKWVDLNPGKEYSYDVLLKSRHRKQNDTLDLIREKLPRFDELPEGLKTAIFDVAWNIGGTRFQDFDGLELAVNKFLSDRSNENLEAAIMELGTIQRYDGTHYNNFGQRYIERASWASGFPIEKESPYGGWFKMGSSNDRIKEKSDSTIISRSAISPMLENILLNSKLGSHGPKRDYGYDITNTLQPWRDK